MPIPSQTPYAEHTGNGVTTSFAYEFTVLSADDMRVKVDGAAVSTGFTVSGIGSRSGGAVVFSVAPASLATVYLYREVSLEREIDYQENGDLLAETLDDDFDRLWMAMQDRGAADGRTLRVPVGETLAELPAAAGRASKYLGFDSGGNRVLLDAPSASDASALVLALVDQSDAAKGAGMVGFGAALNYAAGTIGAHANADRVFVVDFMTNTQRADWLARAGAVDMASAFVAAHALALASKRSVYASAGVYRLESRLDWSPAVSLYGDAKSWWGAGAGYPYISGTWLYKAHNDYCLSIVGATANTTGGTVSHITIRSDWATYPTGGGIWVDKVAEQRLEHINAIYVSGDSFHIGDTAGDVTTHCYLTDCYSNNSNARSFYVRAKWTRGYHCKSDGGTWGLHFQDSPQSTFNDSHFEGFRNGAVFSAGSNHCALKGKTYIGNSASATKGVELTANSDYFTIDKTHLVGGGATGAAVSINTCTGVAVLDCVLDSWAKGVLDGGTDSTVRDCAFSACGLPIEIAGNRSNYHDNRMTSTSGSYSILMSTAGTVTGSWTGNDVDKPIYSAATTSTTDFGGIRVVGNPGHKTESAGITASIASGTTVAHGLAGTPEGVIMSTTTGGATNLVWSANATNITFSWTGGNQQISWDAWAKCAKQ